MEYRMRIMQEMSLMEKLNILSDAAKYDISCMILILYSIPQTEVPEFVRFVRTFVLSVVL